MWSKQTKIIERKIRHDATMADYECVPLDVQQQSAVLFYLIEKSFTIKTEHVHVVIPAGSYTIGFYWAERPYNVYMWRDREGTYLGSYFNIVRNTRISPEMVSYEDLIIDVMVLPSGEYFVLDEHELPEPLESFENGTVRQALSALTDSLDGIMSEILSESENRYRHGRFIGFM